MKSAISAIMTAGVLLLGAVGSGTLLTGCQIPGRVVSTETSRVCPLCRTQTVTSPIKGMTYKKHVCPDCKKVSTIDPAAPTYLRDYVAPGQQTIHVCAHCEAAVSKCPLCRNP